QAFLSVTSILSMAVFRHHFVLEDLVEEMRRQSPALSFGPLQPDGHIAVQGPFPALRVLREFLLLKAKSLSEDDKGEAKSHQRQRRRLLEHRGASETRSSVGDAPGEKQVVVLDTDIYLYMRRFLASTFQADGVVVSGVTDGDITTVSIDAPRKAGTAHGLRVRKAIENCSVELQRILRKERLCFQGSSTGQKQRFRRLCERLKPRYPDILIVPYDTHVDVVGTSADVGKFTEEVR
ncbi:RBM43 protein, partial [Dyaphorophyia castanea]|nr:RBM43 protein [Platysteira castanea]